MKKFPAPGLTACMAFIAGSAFASDEMAHDAMAKGDAMKRDSRG